MDWFELPVASVEKATKEATSVTFDVPDTISAIFDWLPGQHVRLMLPVGEEAISRNYSISAPVGRSLRITVKQVKNGQGSAYINQTLKPGQVLQVTPPMGSFVLRPDAQARRSHYFFAAGSGITPIYSMLVSMLEHEAQSYAYLLFGNKDGKSTIFEQELSLLAETYPDRLVIAYCHSSPSWFKESPWRTGRIDADAVEAFIRENPPYAQDAQYYLCGPGRFLPDIKQALNDIDVPDSRIHMESFGGPVESTNNKGVAANVSVLLRGQPYQIKAETGQTLLQAMLKQGVEAPYSCEGGVCGSCRCKLKRGDVQMHNNMVLDQDEVKRGEILACQSVALTAEVAVEFT